MVLTGWRHATQETTLKKMNVFNYSKKGEFHEEFIK